jgi:hypothetical protein
MPDPDHASRAAQEELMHSRNQGAQEGGTAGSKPPQYGRLESQVAGFIFEDSRAD